MELENTDIWRSGKGPSDITFAVFLDRTHICDEKWYLRRRAVYADPSLAAHVPSIGLAAMTLVAEISDEQLRADAIELLSKAAENRGAPLIYRTAKDKVDKLTGGKKCSPTQKTRREVEIIELKKEVKRLRAENESLREKVAELETELEAARKPVGKYS